MRVDVGRPITIGNPNQTGTGIIWTKSANQNRVLKSIFCGFLMENSIGNHALSAIIIIIYTFVRVKDSFFAKLALFCFYIIFLGLKKGEWQEKPGSKKLKLLTTRKIGFAMCWLILDYVFRFFKELHVSCISSQMAAGRQASWRIDFQLINLFSNQIGSQKLNGFEAIKRQPPSRIDKVKCTAYEIFKCVELFWLLKRKLYKLIELEKIFLARFQLRNDETPQCKWAACVTLFTLGSEKKLKRFFYSYN